MPSLKGLTIGLPKILMSMTYLQTASDKADERLLRSLLNDDATPEQAQRIFKRVFSDLIKWSTEDIEEHLAYAFNFRPLEIEHLFNKFTHELPTQANLALTYRAFPCFDNDFKRAEEYGNNFEQAKHLLNKVKQSLSKIALFPGDFWSLDDWDKFIKERQKWNSFLSEFSNYIDEHSKSALNLSKK